MNNILKLVMGDISGDGHDKRDAFIIKSTLTKDQILKAYAKGCKKIGFDLQTCCEEYESSSISTENWNRLVELGFEGEKEDEGQGDDQINLWTDLYLEIWLFFVKVGNPLLEYSNVGDGEQTINIGGYGLYE